VTQPVIRDKRRIDPTTGKARQAAHQRPAAPPADGQEGPQGSAEDTPQACDAPDCACQHGAQVGACEPTADATSPVVSGEVVEEPPAPDVAALQALVDERTADLQRLQAEYANYKKRVDRDRALSRQAGIEDVVRALLPVIDSVEAARQHDELVGGFKLVADELEKVATTYGLTSFGEVGEPFDPQRHEALMQMPYEQEVTEPTIAAVMQRGALLHDRVLRPARVGVASPSQE